MTRCQMDHDHDNAWYCAPPVVMKSDNIQRDVLALTEALNSLTEALKATAR